MEKLLTKNKIAEIYDVSPRTIVNWMRRKVIPYVRIGNVVRFDPEKVDQALAKHTVRAAGGKGGEI